MLLIHLMIKSQKLKLILIDMFLLLLLKKIILKIIYMKSAKKDGEKHFKWMKLEKRNFLKSIECYSEKTNEQSDIRKNQSWFDESRISYGFKLKKHWSTERLIK